MHIQIHFLFQQLLLKRFNYDNVNDNTGIWIVLTTELFRINFPVGGYIFGLVITFRMAQDSRINYQKMASLQLLQCFYLSTEVLRNYCSHRMASLWGVFGHGQFVDKSCPDHS